MIIFKVFVNDRPLCSAGADDLSVLTAMITAGGQLGEHSHGARRQLRSARIDLCVGGLTSRSADLGNFSKDEHLDWARKVLALGDEVRIKLVDKAKADHPISARPAGAVRETQQRQQFEWAKKFYFANRSRYEKRLRTRRRTAS